MATVTFDTNLVDDASLTQTALDAGFEVAHTTVTDRELAGSGVAPASGRKAQLLETGVVGESLVGVSVWGSADDAACFEMLLNVISNGAFPPPGKRDNLTLGQRRQLRDAMIFCTHVREKRQVFVTNDSKGFIDNGRREVLQSKFNATILTREEFLELCHAK